MIFPGVKNLPFSGFSGISGKLRVCKPLRFLLFACCAEKCKFCSLSVYVKQISIHIDILPLLLAGSISSDFLMLRLTSTAFLAFSVITSHFLFGIFLQLVFYPCLTRLWVLGCRAKLLGIRMDSASSICILSHKMQLRFDVFQMAWTWASSHAVVFGRHWYRRVALN